MAVVTRPSSWLLLLVLFLFGGYGLLLQHRLSSRGPKGSFSRGRGFRGDAASAAIQSRLTATVLQEATKEEFELIKQTKELAEEVAKLAKAVSNKHLSTDLQTVDGILQALEVAKQMKEQEEDQHASSVTIAAVQAEEPQPLSEQEVTRRRQAIVAAVKHSWQGYAKYAWGFDELMPAAQKGKNSFGGLGATIVDSLDTLWLVGLKDEFQEARDWVANDLDFDKSYDASVFETTIRVVGGLLSVYEMSGDEIFLGRAIELGQKLMKAFDTPTGIPFNTLNLKTLHGKNPAWTQKASTLSEFGTEQIEYAKLSQLSGDASFGAKSERVIKFLHDNFPDKALMPIYLNPETGKFTTQKLSMGAMGDSYYEYLLKMWLLKGKREEMYRSMWVRAMDEMITKMIATSPDGLTYITEIDRRLTKRKMDHLACFVPAMLALGVHTGAINGSRATQYMQLAESLTYTCWKMYEQQPTGLAPEYVRFTAQGMVSGAHHNLMRPEALEAMFVLWRCTGQNKYREWAWRMFSAWEKHCKVENGYVGLKDVRKDPPQQDDMMQSFWLAETLKYPFLIYSDSSVLPLDQWVFNTEAHPMRIIV